MWPKGYYPTDSVRDWTERIVTALPVVSFAAVFWAVTQRSPQNASFWGGGGGALRDRPKNGCEGDYLTWGSNFSHCGLKDISHETKNAKNYKSGGEAGATVSKRDNEGVPVKQSNGKAVKHEINRILKKIYTSPFLLFFFLFVIYQENNITNTSVCLLRAVTSYRQIEWFVVLSQIA